MARTDHRKGKTQVCSECGMTVEYPGGIVVRHYTTRRGTTFCKGSGRKAPLTRGMGPVEARPARRTKAMPANAKSKNDLTPGVLIIKQPSRVTIWSLRQYAEREGITRHAVAQRIGLHKETYGDRWQAVPIRPGIYVFRLDGQWYFRQSVGLRGNGIDNG